MLKLLKTEIASYYKIALFFALSMALWLFIVLAFLSHDRATEKDFIGVPAIAVVVTAITALYMTVDRIKTRRDRLHALLPVSSVHIGLVRHLSLTIFWLFTVLLLAAVLIIMRPEAAQWSFLARIVSINGLFLAFVTTYFISRNLALCLQGKRGPFGIRYVALSSIIIPLINLLLIIWFVFLPLPYIGLQVFPNLPFLIGFIYSTGGTLFINVLWIFLVVFDVWLYSRRKSFLI